MNYIEQCNRLIEFKDKLCDLVCTCMQTMNRPSLNRETSNSNPTMHSCKDGRQYNVKIGKPFKMYYNSHEIRAIKSLN